ncbi:PREDICTED: fatty acyl-CoA reductase 1-like [Rhagoletis zephyria]|uniref:fatty acyl-CoA reductase 1-like n=1 Tax=Rhagoletis zephyria TaxID=28612 RepID=UPI00081125F5|nr:PREDICTED: fatty acyl-CoA reductase 1-like [Rhagoletis zephyria]
MNGEKSENKIDIEVLEKRLYSEGVLNYDLSDEEVERSPIRNYFKRKTIFLTGGTGFLGQLLMEKLLRCEVEMVYFLARPKKNKTAHERLNDLFDQTQFAKLRREYPNYRQHVSIIEGDMSLIDLGIKDSDRQLLAETVEIVLHAAAEVRFNDSLHKLATTNLRGTRQMLKLAENFKKLQVFHYVSTAFSNCKPNCKVIKEEFYEPPLEPNTLIAYAEKCINTPEDLDIFDTITNRLIGEWPNTYTFSKCLSEELVRRRAEKFPTCVSRPSIVISTNREPIAGWINNVYGITGSVFALAAGLSRLLPIDKDKHLDLICADFTINAILAATWAMHQDVEDHRKVQLSEGEEIAPTEATLAKVSPTPPSPKIYALVSSTYTPAGLVTTETVSHYLTNPLQRHLWVVCPNITGNLLLFKYLSIYYHLIGTLAIDFGLKIVGRKERILPWVRKTQLFLNVIAYFTQYDWKFDYENMRDVWKRMDPVDQKLFLCDTRLFDYKKWCFTYMQGMKHFICNDPLENPKTAVTRYNRISWVHLIFKYLFYISQLLLAYAVVKGLKLDEAFVKLISIKFGLGKGTAFA